MKLGKAKVIGGELSLFDSVRKASPSLRAVSVPQTCLLEIDLLEKGVL